MKNIFKLTIVALAALFTSCESTIGPENSLEFARTVVTDVAQNRLSETMYYAGWIHKAHAWHSAMGDEATQNMIEDLYFNRMEPRVDGNAITILNPNKNEIDIVIIFDEDQEDGGQWRVVNTNNDLGFEIVANQLNDEQWDVKKVLTRDNQEEFELHITIKTIGEYVVWGEGDIYNVYKNSPVTWQNVEISEREPLIMKDIDKNAGWREDYVDYRSVIVDGSMKINLLSDSETVIRGDEIDIDFELINYDPNYYDSSLSSASTQDVPNTKLTWYEYISPEPIVNAHVTFRGMGEIFELYHDVFYNH